MAERLDIKDGIQEWINKINTVLDLQNVDGAFVNNDVSWSNTTFTLTGGKVRSGTNILDVPGASLTLPVVSVSVIGANVASGLLESYLDGNVPSSDFIPLFVVTTNNQRIISAEDVRTWAYEDSGAAAAAVSNHEGKADPHSQYYKDGDNINAGVVDTGTGAGKNLQDALNDRVIYVDTIADLQALPTSELVDGQAATTRENGDFTWDAGTSQWVSDTDRYPSVVSGAPYVSMKQKLQNAALDFVADFNAPDDGTGDASEAMKEFMDFGNKRLNCPAGIFNFAKPVVVHDQSGLDIRGYGQELTTFTASTDLLLDTSELSSLPISYQSEYNKRGIFHVTAFDGESGRVDKAARNTFLRDILVDFSGTPAERVASLLASPQFAWAEFHNIRLVNALALAEFWITSGEDSRFYHLLFDTVRTKDCVHHIKNTDYEASSIIQVGTTWNLVNNAIARNDYGYELYGLNYSALNECSVDNQKQGAWAIDIYSCRGLEVSAPGVETRFEQAGVGYGGGILRVRDNSNVRIGPGFFVGGDRDGNGTGSISDYGVSDMYLIDNSRVHWEAPQIDVKVDAGGDYYPITIKNSAYLEFTQGNDAFGFDAGDFNTLGNGRVLTRSNAGALKFFAGSGTAQTVQSEGVVDVTFDDVTYIGTTNSLDDANQNMVYRISQTGTGTSFGHPRDTGLFGVLRVQAAGIYVYQDLQYNNGETYRRTSANTGSDWSAWVKLSP